MQFRVSGAFLTPDRKLKLFAGYGIPPAPEVSVLSRLESANFLFKLAWKRFKNIS